MGRGRRGGRGERVTVQLGASRLGALAEAREGRAGRRRWGLGAGRGGSSSLIPATCPGCTLRPIPAQTPRPSPLGRPGRAHLPCSALPTASAVRSRALPQLRPASRLSRSGVRGVPAWCRATCAASGAATHGDEEEEDRGRAYRARGRGSWSCARPGPPSPARAGRPTAGGRASAPRLTSVRSASNPPPSARSPARSPRPARRSSAPDGGRGRRRG